MGSVDLLGYFRGGGGGVIFTREKGGLHLKDAYWHYLDNSDIDDFERGNTDAFTFEDDCIKKSNVPISLHL